MNSSGIFHVVSGKAEYVDWYKLFEVMNAMKIIEPNDLSAVSQIL